MFHAVCLGSILIAGSSGFAHALTRDAIEADWARQREVRVEVAPITPADDAGGGCDGVVSGKWGFHTAHEMHPWWQVDLGEERHIERVRLYNRCDEAFAARAADFILLLSSDGAAFRQVYQHKGAAFYGYSDSRPLDVFLTRESARFVRLQLPGKEYLHLDEVEVYASESSTNIALGKAATQSSVSEWSTSSACLERNDFMSLERVVRRGQALAASLARLGVDVSRAGAHLTALTANADGASPAEREALLNEALWTVRDMTLLNPLLDFDEILFVKRAPTLFPHVSDQYYGWFSRGGGGIYALSGFTGRAPRLRCLTEGWPEGNFLRPDISHDGTRVLFAYCRYYPHVASIQDKTIRENLPEDAFYHVYEMNIDGTGARQLTHGRYNDADARYLPNGDIVFTSTRKGIALQADRDSAAATLAATLPDSYVRCGGDAQRPVPVFTLHRMNGDGGCLQAISAFENFEWTPAVHHDGQILYARWDYIDRFNGDYMSLWSTRPDGSNGHLIYGNFTSKPQCVFEARPIPNSHKIVFTATAHHSITGGSLAILDRRRGSEFEAPLERITPEVCFPETEGQPKAYYAGPWPLSEEHFLVSWADRPLPPHCKMDPDDASNPANASGIYLYDVFGNLTLLHRDPNISSETPLPVKPRMQSFVAADAVDWDAPKQGALLLQNVYEGMGDLPRDAVARLRIVGVLPKVQPFMNQPVLGVSAEDTGKFILGTVPVEADGSAHFLAPSGIPLFFQALDHDGKALRTMRSLTYVQPGQTLSCVGCHESRMSTPLCDSRPAAGRRPPSKIAPEAEGSWPLRYDALVQPVIDRHCVRCHQPEYADARAAALDLRFPDASYDALLGYADGDLRALAFEKSRSDVGDCPARRSKLAAFLAGENSHADVKLEPSDWDRVYAWMDVYAHRQGAFSAEQEESLRQLRREADWLARD